MTLRRAIEIADILMTHEEIIKKKIFGCFHKARCINPVCLMANLASLATLIAVSVKELEYFFNYYAAQFL